MRDEHFVEAVVGIEVEGQVFLTPVFTQQQISVIGLHHIDLIRLAEVIPGCLVTTQTHSGFYLRNPRQAWIPGSLNCKRFKSLQGRTDPLPEDVVIYIEQLELIIGFYSRTPVFYLDLIPGQGSQ